MADENSRAVIGHNNPPVDRNSPEWQAWKKAKREAAQERRTRFLVWRQKEGRCSLTPLTFVPLRHLPSI